MAMILVGGTIPWCEPAEFLKRYHPELVGDLCSDGNVRLTPAQLVGQAGNDAVVPPIPYVPPNVNLEAALADASGAVESAVLANGRYSVDDLQAMADDANARNYMRRLVADIAIVYLHERRGVPLGDTMKDRYDRTMKELASLRSGSTMLPFDGTIDASLPDDEFETPSEISMLNLLSSRVRRGLGTRTRDLPRGTF
jgi:hypothetical protein